MKSKVNSVLTFHTDKPQSACSEQDVMKLTAWMLTSYNKFIELATPKMLITIKQSTVGIHRNSKHLHGHIAVVYELQTFKKNPDKYVSLDGFKTAFRSHLNLPPSPFQTSVRNKAVHLSLKINEPNTDHLSYVLKEYKDYDSIDLKSHVYGVEDLEARRLFAHTKYLQTIKANEYRDKYENKSTCQLTSLMDKLDTSQLPSENKPVTLYVEILTRLNDIWCELENTNQKYQIYTKLQGIAYNVSRNLIKLPKNRLKLMLHHFKTHIPKEEREQNEIIQPFNISMDKDAYVKYLNKITSNAIL